MFSFIPQLLIILSLVGIILIVLRRTPELTRFPVPVLLRNALEQVKKWGAIGLAKLWHYIVEAKELTAKSHPLQYLPKFRLPAVKLPPLFKSKDSAEHFISQGERALEKGEYAEAEGYFIKAIKKDPHSEPAFSYLGKLYLAQNKTMEAIETFKFLVKHHPENSGYHNSLGQAYHNHKLYDKAVVSYEKAIELDPADAKRYVSLGLTLEAKKHFGEAILNYRKAVDLEPENTQFVMVLCEALSKSGNKEEAETLLEKVLMLEPTNHLAREKLMQLKY